MKKIVAMAVLLLFVVAILVTPSFANANGDCKGSTCTTPQCGEAGPSGLRLCAREINPNSNVKTCWKDGINHCKPDVRHSFVQEDNTPKLNPNWTPGAPFHFRDCRTTLSCNTASKKP